MASDVASRRAAHPAIARWPAQPPAESVPRRWELAADDAHAIWWWWLDVPDGASPRELESCWFRIDDLGMGLGLYVPRRLGSQAVAIDDELLNVVRLVDLEGWSRRKAGRRLFGDDASSKTTARALLKSGRAQLATAGVLPWASWPRGKLPDAWWTEPDTCAAIAAWRASAAIARDDHGPLRRFGAGAASRAAGVVEATLGRESARTQQLSYDARRLLAAASAASHVTAGNAWATIARRLPVSATTAR